MERRRYLNRIGKAFSTHRVVALLGPRQCGKTTLAQLFADQSDKPVHRFDLEDPADLRALEEAKRALEPLRGLIILDEIQRLPDLFPLLRVLVDQKEEREFLILGSASRALIRQSSETLAGRIAYLELTPFTAFEVNEEEHLWVRGGFPQAYLAQSDEASLYWRKQYVATFLERDIPALGIKIAPLALRRFWMMLAHYHGQTFNASEIASSLGISDTTVRHYLDILCSTFMVRQLLPWIENLKKRQVKRPKIYLRDSGIFHTLMEIGDRDALIRHPKLGASWEGFALEEVVCALEVTPEECFYWGVHGQAELDLLIFQGGKRLGFEFKFQDAPAKSRSMQQALSLLNLDALKVVYPGDKAYQLDERIEVLPLSHFAVKKS